MEITSYNVGKSIEISSQGKITREPTSDQLDLINKLRSKEEDKDSIDWNYIKDTVNLSREEKLIRYKQDVKEIEEYFNKIARDNEKNYLKEIQDLKDNKKLQDKDGASQVKAKSILANLSRGVIVSSADKSFAEKIFPGEVGKAARLGEERRKTVIENIGKMLNYIDLEI